MRPSRAARRPEPSAAPAAEPGPSAAPAGAAGPRLAAVPAPGRRAAPAPASLIAAGGTVLAAFLYGAACPPHEWSLAAWAVPGLLLGCTASLSWRRALAHGVVFALLIGYGITSWTYGASLAYFGFHRVLAAAFVSAMWLVYGGIPYGVLVVAYGRLIPRVPAWARAPVGAWLWVVAELGRSSLFTGLPWELLGHTQFRHLVLVQIADLGGVTAVSFVLALASLACADVVRTRRVAPAGIALPVMLLVAVLAYGIHARRIHGLPTEGDGGRTVVVVQGNVPNEFRWKRAFFERTLATYAALSGAGRETPDVIVWPENAANFYVNREPLLLAQLGTVAARARDGLVVGGPRLADDGLARNTAYLIGGSGTILAAYDKRRLVPFAEYDPFRTGAPPSDGPVYVPGGDAALLRTSHLNIGTVICYEVLFPHLVRDLVRKGADVLFNLSNDAWLGDGAARPQHFSMTVFRAIETRRFLVRAAATGVSGFVSPTGEPYATLAADTAGATAGRVVPRHELTPYVRFGDAWVLAAGVLLLALVGAGARKAAA